MDPYSTIEDSGDMFAATQPAHGLLQDGTESLYSDSGSHLTNSPFTGVEGMGCTSDAPWASANHYTCSASYYSYEGPQYPSFPPGSAVSLFAPRTAFQSSDFGSEYLRGTGPSAEGAIQPGFGVAHSPPVHYTAHGGLEEKMLIPAGVRMPQRKGGMQLWQFLYALLTDQDNQYHNLIEWTANRKEREFRLLQPEAIAIWWGHHKNKENMSYDKLSRSLRYYYDKGLLRKIPGERFVYRFCIDPEMMYKHIGNSESRPYLKPMPQAAKLAISKSKILEGEQSIEMSTNPFVALPPESLPMPVATTPHVSRSLQPLQIHMHNGLASSPAAAVSTTDLLSQPGNLPLKRCPSQEMDYHGANSWEGMRNTPSPISYSVSPPEFQLAADSSFYSPYSSAHGSPFTLSPSVSPSPPSTYSTILCEGAVFDFHTSSLSPSSHDNLATHHSSTLSVYESDYSQANMWAFAQE